MSKAQQSDILNVILLLKMRKSVNGVEMGNTARIVLRVSLLPGRDADKAIRNDFSGLLAEIVHSAVLCWEDGGGT